MVKTTTSSRRSTAKARKQKPKKTPARQARDEALALHEAVRRVVRSMDAFGGGPLLNQALYAMVRDELALRRREVSWLAQELEMSNERSGEDG